MRSSANIQSGARSKLSAILHGVFMLVFVMVLPHVLNLVPLSVLASILFVVGYKLAKPALWKQMYGLGMAQFLPFTITVLAIVFTDLLTGIGLGMVAALFAILRAHYMNSHFMHIEEKNENGGAHQVKIQFAEEVTFLNRAAILKELKQIPDGSHVTIEEFHSFFIDQDVIEIIDDFEKNAASRNIKVTRVREPQEGASITRMRSPRLASEQERKDRISQ